MACLFVPVLAGSNVLSVNASPRTHSNGDKVSADCGAKRSPELAFLLARVQNMKILFGRPKMRHGFLQRFPIPSHSDAPTKKPRTRRGCCCVQGRYSTDLSASTSFFSDIVARSAILRSNLAAVVIQPIASEAPELGIHLSTQLSPVM